MAGVTNVAFRTLCRELEQEKVGTVSGLYVCEMVTARALVERHPVTMHMTTFAPEESPRSLQLYTVDPDTTYAAAKMIVEDDLADHIDMNFGCPVPKVTRRGGGAALPYKRRLFGQIVAAAVRATEGTDIPVTVKFRIGIDDAHHTHLDAGRIAEQEGAAAVALHARTAAQRYSGAADWEQIAQLKQHVTSIPVLGNGDIFDASDALTMMAVTGCDGVVIGRGCLGRPWLFAELSAAFTGAAAPTPPTLGEVADIVRRHGALLADHFGEDKGMRDIRKHVAWYLHGFPAGADLRRALALVKTLGRARRTARRAGPGGAVSARGDRTARTPGLRGLRRTAGRLAGRSGRLHSAGRGRRYALRWLNRDAVDIRLLRLSKYDVNLFQSAPVAERVSVLLRKPAEKTEYLPITRCHPLAPPVRATTRDVSCTRPKVGKDMGDDDNATPGDPYSGSDSGSKDPSKWLTRTTRPAPAAAPWERRPIPPVDESRRRWRRDGQPHRRRIRGRPVRPAHRGDPGRAAAAPRHRTGVRRTGSPPAGRRRPADHSRHVGLRIADSRPGCAAATTDRR